MELTPAEAEVARLLAQGYRPAEIAELRFVAVATVRTQIKALRKRLGARTTVQAVVMALAKGA